MSGGDITLALVLTGLGVVCSLSVALLIKNKNKFLSNIKHNVDTTVGFENPSFHVNSSAIDNSEEVSSVQIRQLGE